MKDLNKLREEDPKAYVRQIKRYVEMIENGNKDEVSLEVQLKIIREDWRDPILQKLVWGYVVEEKSARELAEVSSVSSATIKNRLRERGLTRSISKAVHTATKNDCLLSDR
ncbi:MAG: hypothetical protein ACOC5T_05205, partial [Elusimicrobiota bacterium]